MQLSSLVAGPVHGCGPADTIESAAKLMAEFDYGALAVVESSALVGIFTERDLVQAVSSGADAGSARIEDWMTTEPDTAAPNLEVAEAAEWMLAVGYRHLPICDGEELVGMTSIKDVLWALVDGDG